MMFTDNFLAVDIFLKSVVQESTDTREYHHAAYQYQIKSLNRPSLAAGMCRELKIAEYIDVRITNDPDARNVINGPGFTGPTLHLFPEFFENKPIDLPYRGRYRTGTVKR